MISKSDQSVAIIVKDDVGFFKHTFVLNTFRKTFHDETKRLGYPEKCDKHLKNNISRSYAAAKAIVAEVPKHCPFFLKVGHVFRDPLCKVCSLKIREAEQKLNSFPVKAGFKIHGTALFKLLTAQVAF